MGEYAEFSGERIKIGTCESMYYLRWDDRYRVSPLSGNVNPAMDTGLFFRLPFPDEDEQLPGEYQEFNRGYRLGSKSAIGWTDWTPEGLDDCGPGHIQLSHTSGLLLSVPCHHGVKLPEVGPGTRAHWNGKSHAIELCFVKSMPGGSLRPVYRCRFCESMWSCDWDEILPYCGLDAEMLRRLTEYANVGETAVSV